MIRSVSRSDQATLATHEFNSAGILKIHLAFHSADNSPFTADALSVSISVFKEVQVPPGEMASHQSL